MARYTVTARTYVSLNGASQANAGWGLELRATGLGTATPSIMDVYAHSKAGWSLLGGLSIYPDYSGVLLLGKGEQIGRSMVLGTIPRGTAQSQLEVSSRVTIGTGDFLIEGSARGDYWKSTRGGNDTILGLGGNDTLSGDAGNDMIFGGTGNDSLIGGAGNDYLQGDAGRDTLIGGTGNDRYVIDRSDVIIEYANEGIDHVYADFDYRLGANLENLTLTGWWGYSGTGNSLNNVIRGNAGNNLLRGEAGDDSLYGGDGNDTLIGGSGDDLLQGGAGNDLLRGGDGIDTADYTGRTSVRVDLSLKDWQITGHGLDMLVGIENLISGSGNDRLIGDALANVLNGGAGNDSLVGGAGNDTLIGGLGADTLVGGAGNDTFWIDNTGDRVVELAGGGIDRIYASIGIDLARAGGVYANVENVRLTGGAALNAYGSEGNNVLVGNVGANKLAGRAGNDVLTGGAGADTFIFGKGYDSDRITDFQDGIDRIRLQGFDDVKTVEQARGHATQVGADVVFDFGDGDRLTVQNTRLATVLDDLIFL